MIDLKEAVRRLKINEGMELQPYICPAGYLTIGIGRNLVTNPLNAEEKRVCEGWERGITSNQAYYLCKNDIIRINKLLHARLGFLYDSLDNERQFALVDMCFNLGYNGLLKFEKMLNSLEIGDYRGAAKEVLNSKYAAQVKKRAVRNAQLLERGKWIED